MKTKTFRDVLGYTALFLFVLLWVLDGAKVISLSDTVIGATITIFTLIFQFYFRRAQPGETAEK